MVGAFDDFASDPGNSRPSDGARRHQSFAAAGGDYGVQWEIDCF
jgi:hypothetical protein